MNDNWPKRFIALKKGMKKYVGKNWSNQDVADITGNSEGSTQAATCEKGKFPRSLKLAVVVFEIMEEKKYALPEIIGSKIIVDGVSHEIPVEIGYDETHEDIKYIKPKNK